MSISGARLSWVSRAGCTSGSCLKRYGAVQSGKKPIQEGGIVCLTSEAPNVEVPFLNDSFCIVSVKNSFIGHLGGLLAGVHPKQNSTNELQRAGLNTNTTEISRVIRNIERVISSLFCKRLSQTEAQSLRVREPSRFSCALGGLHQAIFLGIDQHHADHAHAHPLQAGPDEGVFAICEGCFFPRGGIVARLLLRQ